MYERARQLARNVSVDTLAAPLVWLVVLGCFAAWGYFLYQKEFRRALTFLECRKDWRSTGEYCESIYRTKANDSKTKHAALYSDEEDVPETDDDAASPNVNCAS
tara:strand:- start:41 stop:352 length:312 start_codon:yes stop_codon:yes gene_type:complete